MAFCPICKAGCSIDPNDHGLIWDVNCSECKNFRLHDFRLRNRNDEYSLSFYNEEELVILKYWMQNKRDINERVELNKKKIDNIIKNTELPTLTEQTDNILKLLHNLIKSPGEKYKLDDLKKIAPKIGAINEEGVDFVLNHLEGCGIIEINRYFGENPEISFTFKGWTLIEQKYKTKKDFDNQSIIKLEKKSIEIANKNIEKMKNYLFLIGIDKYKDFPDLDSTINDAENLKNILIKNYNFDKKNTLILKNPTRSEIFTALSSLNNKLDDKSNLLIFFAGHGSWNDQRDQGYWLPTDATSSDYSNWISNSDIVDHIKSYKAKHILLISDACFSGSIFKTRDAKINVAAIKLFEKKSRRAITSGNLQPVPDKSIFFKYFLKFLSNNKNKYMDSQSLYCNIKSSIIAESENIPQYGIINNTGDAGGDFIFCLK